MTFKEVLEARSVGFSHFAECLNIFTFHYFGSWQLHGRWVLGVWNQSHWICLYRNYPPTPLNPSRKSYPQRRSCTCRWLRRWDLNGVTLTDEDTNQIDLHFESNFANADEALTGCHAIFLIPAGFFNVLSILHPHSQQIWYAKESTRGSWKFFSRNRSFGR